MVDVGARTHGAGAARVVGAWVGYHPARVVGLNAIGSRGRRLDSSLEGTTAPLGLLARLVDAQVLNAGGSPLRARVAGVAVNSARGSLAVARGAVVRSTAVHVTAVAAVAVDDYRVQRW